jgi:hypothetical protein
VVLDNLREGVLKHEAIVANARPLALLARSTVRRALIGRTAPHADSLAQRTGQFAFAAMTTIDSNLAYGSNLPLATRQQGLAEERAVR